MMLLDFENPDEHYPLNPTNASLEDIAKAFRHAMTVVNNSSYSLHDVFDIEKVIQSNSVFTKKFVTKNGKIQVGIQVENQNVRRIIADVQPFYEGKGLKSGKGWAIDPAKVPTTKSNLIRGSKNLEYPYSIAIYLGAAGGIDSINRAQSNQRGAYIRFSNINDFKTWIRFINPKWKYYF